MKKTEGYLCLKCLKTFTSEIEYNVSLSLKNVKTMFSTYYTCQYEFHDWELINPIYFETKSS